MRREKVGYYQMKVGRENTKAKRKDPRYIVAFDWLRDLGYTVRQARICADEAVQLMDQHPDWSLQRALNESL